ncbi:hypothetical protein CSW48_05565, partial [Thermus scotoductus]
VLRDRGYRVFSGDALDEGLKRAVNMD